MAAVMMKLNTRARDLATTALISLMVALLTAFTFRYNPDQREGIFITRGEPGAHQGLLIRPW